MKNFIILILVILNYSSKITAIEERPLSMDNKECYSWQDIEIIIFNEIQE